MENQRQGVLVKPENRYSERQVALIDSLSREILEEIGIVSFNERATELFKKAGCRIDGQRVFIPSKLIDRAFETAPSVVTLGARDPHNRLILDASEPRVRFGTGSETNRWLDIQFEEGKPIFTSLPGSLELLSRAAHLAENLEHLDFFIRCVNIQDKAINRENKDVNMFFRALNHTSKHVQAGLTSLEALDDVVSMAEMIAGGGDDFSKNPVLSFITCLIKSPLQLVEDTGDKFIEITKRRVPIVISSSPMGGATAPFSEPGIVAQINAELLAGITLNQIVSPGAPVLYGAVPVRVRLDNLNDMYAAPEYINYNLGCAQMARHYGIPCYSAMGVADADTPGIQATAEKLATMSAISRGGAQYIHYAFGLLERTNTFCPEQAVLDDAHIGLIKRSLWSADFDKSDMQAMKEEIKEVMQSDHKTFIYSLPLPTEEDVYMRYPLESSGADALYAAHTRIAEINHCVPNHLPPEIEKQLRAKMPGLL
jgi:trimethylamine--corrinoid protein Co-methyltransferase